MKRFDRLAPEADAQIPRGTIMELQAKTTRELRRERMDFARDRIGHNGHGRPSRITYMTHAKGYVMARHPGCVPFVIPEEDWRAFPYWTTPVST